MEYYEITCNDPFFKGHYTKEKRQRLIELKEKEGWKLIGNKNHLVGSFGGGFTGPKLPKADILAILVRDIKSNGE